VMGVDYKYIKTIRCVFNANKQDVEIFLDSVFVA
jgi:hypothetical protein